VAENHGFVKVNQPGFLWTGKENLIAPPFGGVPPRRTLAGKPAAFLRSPEVDNEHF
jgi:hypothetical protein